MLPFWKRTTQKFKSPLSSPEKQLNGTSDSTADQYSIFREPYCLGPLSKFVYDEKDLKKFKNQSRLCLNFNDIFSNKLATCYFSQYLESKNYLSLLNVLFDLEELLKGFISCNGDNSDKKCDTNVVQSIVRAKSNDVVFESAGDGNGRTESKRVRCASESSDRISNVTGIKIWQKYLAEDAPEHLRVPEEIRNKIQASIAEPELSKLAFKKLYNHVIQTLEKDLWCDFIRSEWFCKYQVKVLTSGTVTLSDILYFNNALAAFIEFLEQEGCQEIIHFWLAGINFESNLSRNLSNLDEDPEQVQNNAIVIYDEYLSLQATSPLGINDVTRCEVEQRICGETSKPKPDCFQPALKIALNYLHYHCLHPFLSSQSYLNLLSELMRSTRASGSPASSVTDVSIDSVKNDPDLIWRRRRQHSGLSIGRIDQLGRFETDIEPEPDKKSESRITRVVRKLVNKHEKKAQEEMAWQVAEMIVRNITNVTMGGGNSLSDDEEIT